MSDIGHFIKQKREAAGYSQAQLARATGLNHDSAMSRIENGKRKVSWNELGDIANVLKNFHIFEALKEAGYISEEDIHPILRIYRLEELNDNEIQEVQTFVDFLIYKKTHNIENEAGICSLD